MLAVLTVFVTYPMIYHRGKQTKTISFSASDYPERWINLWLFSSLRFPKNIPRSLFSRNSVDSVVFLVFCLIDRHWSMILLWRATSSISDGNSDRLMMMLDGKTHLLARKNQKRRWYDTEMNSTEYQCIPIPGRTRRASAACKKDESIVTDVIRLRIFWWNSSISEVRAVHAFFLSVYGLFPLVLFHHKIHTHYAI